MFSRTLSAALLAGGLSTTAVTQVPLCPTGAIIPYFGWDATDCGQCNVYGSYLEYLTAPSVGSIRPGGPADGRLHERDTLVAVDGMEITSPQAWRRMRDAEAGKPIQFSVRRGGETSSVTITPSARCPPVASRPNVQNMMRGSPRVRSFTAGNSIVEVDGEPATVSYDPKTGETLIVTRATTIRVRPRP